MPQVNPFSKRVDALSKRDFKLLESAILLRKCREIYGFATFEEAASKYRIRPCCPSCNTSNSVKDGTSASGLQRYRCKACGYRYNSVSGTIFEWSKKDVPTWIEFIKLMCWNIPLEAIAELCDISHQTAFEWRHRVFATVDNYQDDILLRDRIWIDEIYVNDTDLTHGYGEAKKRGLSKQKICIVVAIDIFKNPIAVVCGYGKPSAKRIKECLLSKLKKESVIVHDMEKAHRSLVKASKCYDEAYKADVNNPIYLECMSMINSLCSWLKRYLWRFTGMQPRNLQSYLNWYVYLFRVNQGKEKWPKTERVVRHLLMVESRYRSSRS